MTSLWATATNAGAAPTTAAVPTRATTGALGQGNPLTNPLRVGRFEMGSATSAGAVFILCDRLSHQGGLNGTTTGAQTTNLATAALTRYTSGAGVMAALEIYTAVGATTVDATVSYTNTTPTSGRTSKAIAFGGTGYSTAARILPIALQPGDTGVTSVESVTLSASTLTVGNFGVTLFRPLIAFPYPVNVGLNLTYDPMVNLGACMPQIQSNACLFWIMCSNTGTGSNMAGELTLIED